jgi:hypothetical protein
MMMTFGASVKKWFFALLTACCLAALLFSLVFICFHAGHDHAGAYCPVCRGEETLTRLLGAILWLALFCYPRRAPNPVKTRWRAPHSPAPVSFRVQLNI